MMGAGVGPRDRHAAPFGAGRRPGLLECGRIAPPPASWPTPSNMSEWGGGGRPFDRICPALGSPFAEVLANMFWLGRPWPGAPCPASQGRGQWRQRRQGAVEPPHSLGCLQSSLRRPRRSLAAAVVGVSCSPKVVVEVLVPRLRLLEHGRVCRCGCSAGGCLRLSNRLPPREEGSS